MEFPANLDTIVVRHKITDAAGRPLKGNTVTAVPAERVWATDGSIVQYRASTQIDANGQWELELPYVDQEGIRNKGVPWRVTEHVPGQPKSYFVAPVLAHGAGPIDAAECLVSAPTSRETVIQAGPVTDEAAASLLDQDGEFATRLKDTIATGVAEQVPGAIADIPDVAGAVADAVVQRDLIVASNVRTIIALPDDAPLPPLTDGALVVRYGPPPGHLYLDDFTGGTLGQTPPGWTRRWASDAADWSLVADAEATGGVALKAPGTSGRRLVTWDALDSDPDRGEVEILMRHKPNGSFYAMLRASGAAGSETGYRLGTAVFTGLWAYQGGSFRDIKLVTAPDVGTGWILTRARIESDTLKVKVWADGTTEPAEWTVTATDAAITGPGMVGLLGNAATHVDWIAAATAGRTAMGPA